MCLSTITVVGGCLSVLWSIHLLQMPNTTLIAIFTHRFVWFMIPLTGSIKKKYHVVNGKLRGVSY